ncbi:hypothetical protein CAAN1_02S05292 [[Candida] anglica]|uniref:Uncharacterized protein n=1 Tax=[Candida] anglica TaxID=148631 RepID=A0ABP0ECA2_9ASCO
MDRNPLLPFAYTTSASGDIPLNTTPRDRETRDKNASSMYHTRTPESKRVGPVLNFVPSLKRKMGASFNEKDNIKRREYTHSSADEEDEDGEEDEDDEANATIVDHDDIVRSVTAPPSSPPAAVLASEFDISTQASNVPDSPTHNFPSEWSNADDSLPKRVNRNLSSDADFGIDRFNRFKGPNYLSTDDDKWDSAQQFERSMQLRARDIVIQAFEDMQTTINLEGMQLKEVPDEVKDMDNLVIFNLDPKAHTSYQLYLTNNKLRVLPPSLFKYRKLNVLGLRRNKLEKIPSQIGKLSNLTDLYLGTNRLEYLPHTILDLPHLGILSAGPNPFLEVPDNAIPITTATITPTKNKRYASEPHILQDDLKPIPSLRSLCLNAIAKYDVSYQETKNWKRHTPILYHKLIAKAIQHGQYETRCCECDLIVVEPAAEAFEWWDFLGNKLIPFKREFCSGRCLQLWKVTLHADSQGIEDLDVMK